MTNDSIKVPKSSEIYCCETCDYNTSRSSQYDRHLSTDKHKRNTLELPKVPKSSAKMYSCDCGKLYKYRQGLSKHKKNCDLIDAPIPNNNDTLIMELLKQNQELKEMMMEQNKHMIELAKKK